jgi:ADP-heptose:LPS heptosyltransferase
MHKVVDAARLLKIEGEPPAPYLFTSAATEAYADELTAGKGPILAMAPAANWVGKTWPVERFAQVAIQLFNGPLAGGRLMLGGGPDDMQAISALRSVVARERTIDLAGKVELLATYACLKRARLFIGNDFRPDAHGRRGRGSDAGPVRPLGRSALWPVGEQDAGGARDPDAGSDPRG